MKIAGAGLLISTFLAVNTLAATPPPIELPGRFESALAPADEIILSLSRSNHGSLLDLAGVVAEINKTATKPIVLNILIPESFEPLGGKAKSIVPQELVAFKKELTRKNAALATQVRYHNFPYLQYPWPRDLGEAYWQKTDGKTWQRAFLDLNPGNRDFRETSNLSKWPLDSKLIFKNNLPLEEPQFLREALRKIFGWTITALPVSKQDLEFETLGNRGSNSLILPDGSALMGSTAPAEMKSLFEKRSGKKSLVLPVSFLQVKDITQLYSIVPVQGGCGFALAKSDLLAGLELQKNEGLAQESLEESLFYFAKKQAVGAKAVTPVLESFETARDPRRYGETDPHDPNAGEVRYYDFIVQKTLAAQSQIDAGSDAIAQHLKASKSCASLGVISLPVIPSFPTSADYFESLGESFDNDNFSLATPSPALVVLDQHLVLSDFSNSPAKYRESLRELTVKQLVKAGVKEGHIHFVRPPYDSEDAGSLLSATLVLRALTKE